jgi:DNA-directed RNA polymerase subunit RPC12/RpoP
MVNYCPDCGGKVRDGKGLKCSDENHRARRKSGGVWCHDCGEALMSKMDQARRRPAD